jgi:hypothetical protein
MAAGTIRLPRVGTEKLKRESTHANFRWASRCAAGKQNWANSDRRA